MAEKKVKWFRIIVLGLFIAVIAGLSWLLWLKFRPYITDMDSFRTLVNSMGIWGYLAIILMVAVQIILAVIPAGPFQLAAGFAYGNVTGVILNLIGCALGSGIVFLLVRKFGKRIIKWFVNDSEMDKLEKVINSPRWKWILTIIFLVPGTPKDVIGYFAGLTKIKFWEWMLISTLGRLPAIILTVMGGSAIFDSDIRFAVIIIAVIVVLMALGAIGYKIWLDKKVRKDEES